MSGWDRRSVSDSSPVGSLDFTATKTAEKYLPKGTDWYDFWTNKRYKGGRNVTLETSIDRVPMFVRAGSILPLGPEMQYVGEKPWDNLEIHVYPGADGIFVLYEDEGDNYNYEKGLYSTITFRWKDKSHQLMIGSRQGNYTGMILQRQFVIVMPDGQTRQVTYDGHESVIQM